MDEAWLLLAHPAGAQFLLRAAEAGRKHWAGLTVVTQDTADVLSTDLGRAVIANAATQIPLSYYWPVQAQLKIQELKRRGGGPSSRLGVEKFVQLHQPKERKTGSSCRECWEPWPCAAFALV